MINSIVRRLSIVLLVVATATPILASQAKSSISGTVQDPTGAILPGAPVTLQRHQKVLKSITTDAQGQFQFKGLSPGAYQVEVNEPGFTPITIAVTVGDQSPAPLTMKLALASVHQEVTVSTTQNQVSTQTSENLTGISVSGDQLNNLPVFDQDVVGTLSRFLATDAGGTAGATLVVNGVEDNDLDVSPSAIKEIKINNDPYDAQYRNPGWGRIEITTKPGSLEYHGTGNFIFRDSALNARNAFSVTRPPEQRRIFEGTLTGPVVHSKKTSFVLSADHDTNNLQSFVFAQGLTGPIQETAPSPSTNTLVYGRIDHQVNDNDQFSVGLSYHHRSSEGQGIGALTLPEAGYDTKADFERFHFDQSLVLSPSLVNEFHFRAGQSRRPTVSLSNGPQIAVLGAFTAGGAQEDELTTEYNLGLSEMLSYSHGKHLIKTGVDVPEWSRHAYDNTQNFGGTFEFASLADYAANRPFSFTQIQGNPRLVFYEKNVAAFFQDDYRMRPNLMVSAGMRWDWENYFSDPYSFAPRLAFAYSPDRSQKTVIRGGTGIFNDHTGSGPMSSLLFYDGNHLLSYFLDNPGFPDPLAPGETLSAVPLELVRLDPNFHMPYMGMYSLDMERQVAKFTTLTVSYVGSKRIDSFRSRDVNAPLPPLYQVRPDPDLGIVRQFEASGRGSNDTFYFKLRGQITRYFIGMASYRIGWSYNDTNSIYSFPANSYDLAGEWGRAPWDRRNRVELMGTLNKGSFLNLGVALSVYSSEPFNITTGLDPYNDGMTLARPDGVSRDTGDGPGYSDLDVRWSYDFLFDKTQKDKSPVFTVAVGAFNVLNTVNYNDYVGNLSSPFYGEPVSSDPARRLQLSARFRF